MNRRITAIGLALALCLLTACASKRSGTDEARTRTVMAMDTVMNLTLYGGGDGALDALEDEIERLDASLARGTEGSAVYRLNALGAVNDAAVAYLLQESARIAAATDGAFDPTVAPVLELWGFGSGASEHRVPTEEELSAALAEVGIGNVHIEGAQAALETGAVDLGGIAKGWCAERLSELCAANGAESAVLDLGGDVALVGEKPGGALWRVAIRDPEGGYLGILEAADCCIMTSGVYERWFEENGVRYHHIIDPATGRPADSGLVSATVICTDGVWADALATALCVLGEERAAALQKDCPVPFECILVTADGRVLVSDGLADRFEPEENDYVTERLS